MKTIVNTCKAVDVRFVEQASVQFQQQLQLLIT